MLNTQNKDSQLKSFGFSFVLNIVFLLLAVGTTSADESHLNQHYPDFGFLPPPSEYAGRVFSLSQRYPMQMPDNSILPKFLEIDFKEDWRGYLMAARSYCLEGNVKGRDVEDDFNPASENKPAWFHVPWQHYGKNGREGVHGLTKEAPVYVGQLAVKQKYAKGQMYAIGLYNSFGGYTIGQVWANKQHPDVKKAVFPVGAVVCKILFTDVPVEEVPSLQDPLLWNAYVTEEYKSTKRIFKDVALIQMDLMVRDERAPNGWVFGNYQYNGAQGNSNKWENLMPLGIQWGNDPDVYDPSHDGDGEYTNLVPAVTKINPNLKETIINPDTSELPPTHLGWNGRLNGPADNPRSSCFSCHMTAQAPQISPASPLFLAQPLKPSDAGWMRWFQNLNCTERFDANKPTSSTDFSLQLAASLQNFYDWRDEGSKIVAERYKKNRSNNVNDIKVYEIRRSEE